MKGMIDTLDNARQGNESRTSQTPTSQALRINPFAALKNENSSHNAQLDTINHADNNQLMAEDDVDYVPDLAKTSMFGG